MATDATGPFEVTPAPGKLADLSFIDGDPTENIKDLRRVTRVMKDGIVYDVSALIAR